jgi:hypothetical protein
MDAARFAEMSRRFPRMFLVRERARCTLRKLKRVRVDGHEEIAGAAGNFLARPAQAQASEAWRAFALVADFTTVAAAGENKVWYAHEVGS